MNISKYTLILLLLLLSIIALLLNIKTNPYIRQLSSINGEIHSIASILPEYDHWEDLQFLKEKIQNKRIVVLGESTHYDGSTFEAKSRLIKFLHQELGFDILAFEASQYDMWRLNNNKSLPEIEGLYNFWTQSNQIKELWRYLHEQDIDIAGFDIQSTGSYSDTLRRDSLFNYLTKFNINAIERWPQYYKVASKLNHYLNPYTIKRERLDSVFHELDDIKAFLRSQPDVTANNPYLSFVTDIRTWWECIYNYKVGDPKRFQIRDSIMAHNIINLSNNPKYKDRKIILWMSNLHAFKSNSQFQNYFINTGERINKYFGDSIYTILFTSYASYNDSGQGNLYNVSRKNSLETLLHENKYPYAFISNISNDACEICRVNQGLTYSVRLGAITDGLFFIDTMNIISYGK